MASEEDVLRLLSFGHKKRVCCEDVKDGFVPSRSASVTLILWQSLLVRCAVST